MLLESLSETIREVVQTATHPKARGAFLAMSLMYLLFGIFFGLGIAVAMMFSWKLSLEPPKQALQLLADLPMILLALGFGALGAFLRSLRHSNSPGMTSMEYVSNVFVGAFIGLFAYFLLESRALVKLVYSTVPDVGGELTYHGIALVTVFAGMFSLELLSFVEGRTVTVLGAAERSPKQRDLAIARPPVLRKKQASVTKKKP